jgi:hypothetical protein
MRTKVWLLCSIAWVGCGDSRTRPEVDSGGESPAQDGGETVAGDSGGAPPPVCAEATRLWMEDFEGGNYARWTGNTYAADWDGGHCHDNGFTSDRAHGGSRSHRSEISCPANGDVHRGYGGVQFAGDSPMGAFTNGGTGIDAPHGIVVTFWNWLEAPYRFGDGRWFSFWTANTDCAWGEQVITVGLQDPEQRIYPAHVQNIVFDPGAPAYPMGEWVRISIYLNTHTGDLHLWQNGASVAHASFVRPSTDVCHFHWGAYASGDNSDVVLYEDDMSVWKLEEAWTDFSREPAFQSCE